MKKLFLNAALIVGVFVAASCGGDKGKKDSTNDLTEDKPATDGTVSPDENQDEEKHQVSDYKDKKAIALWNASIYNKAGRKEHDAKWVASFKFGNTLVLTGDTATVVCSDKKSRFYVECKTPDNKIGWVQEYLISVGAELKVATQDLTIYKNPDITSLTSNKIKKGSLIAIVKSEDDTGDFVNAYGYNKKPNGWIKGSKGLSSNDEDKTIAVLLRQVEAAKTDADKLEKLALILDNADFSTSNLYEMANEMKMKIEGAGEEAVEETLEDIEPVEE